MDGPFWVDTRAPHIAADPSSVTPTTTFKALVPALNLPVLGSNYFGYIGKAVRMTIAGRLSTVASPGNGQWAIFWGNGTDANGVNVVQTAAIALTASQTNMTWVLQCIIRCRAMGSGTSGGLLGTGTLEINNAVIASTLQPILLPATAPASVGVDTTAANVLSPQFLMSGTAGTIQVHDVLFESLN